MNERTTKQKKAKENKLVVKNVSLFRAEEVLAALRAMFPDEFPHSDATLDKIEGGGVVKVHTERVR